MTGDVPTSFAAPLKPALLVRSNREAREALFGQVVEMGLLLVVTGSSGAGKLLAPIWATLQSCGLIPRPASEGDPQADALDRERCDHGNDAMMDRVAVRVERVPDRVMVIIPSKRRFRLRRAKPIDCLRRVLMVWRPCR